MNINEYIEKLKLESNNNYIKLNKKITKVKKYNFEIKKIKNNINKKEKLISKYFLISILVTILGTLSLTFLTILLNYAPNILYYLLVTSIGSFYIFINKYADIKYIDIRKLNLELKQLIKLYNEEELEKQQIINKSKIINKKLKILNEINMYLNGIEEVKKNNFVFLNYELEKPKILKKV